MHKHMRRMLGCLAVTGALALSLAPAAYAADELGGGLASVADPVSAQVVETGEGGAAAPQAEEGVARIGDETYATLDEAIEAAQSGDTIVLLADAQVTKTLNKTMTIDGNGHKLVSKDVRYGFGVPDETIHLTLKNMTADFDYTVEVENPSYESDLSLFYINSDTDFTFENVTMSLDGSGASNRLHAFYNDGGSISVFDLVDSTITVSNFPEDALEWSGTSSQFNMTRSHFTSDHNRSGFAGTFNTVAVDSTISVVNSTGNGANGSNFDFTNCEVDFSDNNSHGLSAGTLVIDSSTVTANRNGANGIHTSGTLTIRNGSDVTITGNDCYISSQWTIPGALYVGGAGESTIENSSVTISGNYGSGIYQKDAGGTLTIADSAKVDVTANTAVKLGLGGGLYANGSVALGASTTLYNNHAPQAGDDVYVTETGSVGLRETGADWRLDGTMSLYDASDSNRDKYSVADDCTDAIDGWYDDSADARWEAHADSYDGIHVEEHAVDGTVTVEGPLALKAAHGLGVVTVQPRPGRRDRPARRHHHLHGRRRGLRGNRHRGRRDCRQQLASRAGLLPRALRRRERRAPGGWRIDRGRGGRPLPVPGHLHARLRRRGRRAPLEARALRQHVLRGQRSLHLPHRPRPRGRPGAGARPPSVHRRRRRRDHERTTPCGSTPSSSRTTGSSSRSTSTARSSTTRWSSPTAASASATLPVTRTA